MEYLENNLVPLSAIGIGLVSKKLFKKEVLPVTGWKQILTTFVVLVGATAAGMTIKKEIIKRQTVPKPN